VAQQTQQTNAQPPTQQIATVADTIVNQLAAFGVERIYGVAGHTFLELLDAIDRSKQIQFIAVKHESTAAFMASAEAKLTQKVGVCLATAGPGMANLLNGLGDAYMDKVPVLAITGQVPTKKIGTGATQYLDQQRFIEPLASYSATLSSPDATVDVFAKALQTAEQWSEVAHVSVPKDILMMQQTNAIRRPPQLITGRMQFEAEDVEQAVQILKSAQRPMVVAGVGARAAAQDVKQLCDALGAGLIVSLGAKGIVEESYPRLIGTIGKGGSPYASEMLKQADVVLLAGDNWWPEGYVPQNTRIVQIDYNPANIGAAMNVELGLVGATEVIVPALVQQLKGVQPGAKWEADLQQARQKWYAQVQQEANTEGSPVHPARVIRALQNTVADDAVICIDTGDHSVWFSRIFEAKNQKTVFSGTWRSMGFGLPAAMACQLAEPNKQVVALVGDGCLGMNLADLSTAVRYNLPITILVVNNGTLQMERDRQVVGQHASLGSDLTNPDFIKVAEACGMAGFRVTDSSELDKVLEQALSLPGPVLVDVATEQTMFPNTSPNEG
jgi:pyruvate oxidase